LAIGVVVASSDPVGFTERCQREDFDDSVDFMLAAHAAGVQLLEDPAFRRFTLEQPLGANMVDGVVQFVRQRVPMN
jgi:hypothetical protein